MKPTLREFAKVLDIHIFSLLPFNIANRLEFHNFSTFCCLVHWIRDLENDFPARYCGRLSSTISIANYLPCTLVKGTWKALYKYIFATQNQTGRSKAWQIGDFLQCHLIFSSSSFSKINVLLQIFTTSLFRSTRCAYHFITVSLPVYNSNRWMTLWPPCSVSCPIVPSSNPYSVISTVWKQGLRHSKTLM